MSERVPFACAVTVALLLCTLRAAAEGADPVAAEQLFLAGRAAMERGDLETACQRFSESQRLDPAAGTLINLAECFERRGLVASSWQRWKEAFDGLRSDDERKRGVAERMARIEARLPKLELRLADGAPSGTVVERDGLTLGAASLGLALPIDPGTHHVRVSAEGREPRDYSLTIAEAEAKSLVVEPGAPHAAEPPPAPAPKVATPVVASSHVETPPSHGSARTVGWIAAGTGAVALGAGTVFGVLAIGKKSKVDDDCTDAHGSLFCTQAGLDAARSGHTFATLANIGVAVGIVGLGVGGYLLLTTSPDGDRTALGAHAILGGGSIDVARTF